MNALLCSLDIDKDVCTKGPMPSRLEDYWNESQSVMKMNSHAMDGWVCEYSQRHAEHDDPDAWAHSYEQQHGANGWASEFEKVRKY